MWKYLGWVGVCNKYFYSLKWWLLANFCAFTHQLLVLILLTSNFLSLKSRNSYFCMILTPEYCFINDMLILQGSFRSLAVPLPCVTLCIPVSIDIGFKASLLLCQVLMQLETLRKSYGWQCSIQHFFFFFPLKYQIKLSAWRCLLNKRSTNWRLSLSTAMKFDCVGLSSHPVWLLILWDYAT